jgi:hypothetical protein
VTKFGHRGAGRDVFIELWDVYWVPDLGTCLLSIGRLADAGFETTFTKNGCCLVEAGGRLIGDVVSQGHIYPLQLHTIHNKMALLAIELAEVSDSQLAERFTGGHTALVASSASTKDILHKRMGHIGEVVLQLLASMNRTGIVINEDGNLPDSKPLFFSKCLSCLAGKQRHLPFPKGRTCAEGLLDLLHMDVAGPMETSTMS